ncbi:peptide deformylase [Pedobacter psychrophilus]|uniref:Peptide deformylase n=1 Tax=Pedobacter psychrophilus TaxID=1826909 RepID=A0A179DCV6_9SPHI|nr:peptide deformylase [Pedobacter psychrophilus]OAQ38875.1 peptide deformylase [Pedobacter psychrophilus]
MKLPIVAYGDPVLKKKAQDIADDYNKLDDLISNMFETMYTANGVGLAAPQVGLSIRLFIIDASPFEEDQPELKDFKKVFINAKIVEENGKKWNFNEGCLSIPEIREDVSRHENVLVNYFDENWVNHEEKFTGLAARVIQHEYDHIEGKLFTDRINPLRKTMLKSKLDAIAKGIVKVEYKMKFPLLKKGR